MNEEKTAERKPGWRRALETVGSVGLVVVLYLGLATANRRTPLEQAVADLHRTRPSSRGGSQSWTPQAMVALGPAAVTPLRAGLVDGDPTVRRRSAQALGALGKIAAPAVPDLIRQALGSQEVYDRIACQSALVKIGAPAAEALAPSLTGEGPRSRLAYEVLREIGFGGAIEPLRKARQDPKTEKLAGELLDDFMS